MNSLFNSVLETASLFKNCDGYLQSIILREELTVELDKKYNKYHCEAR